MTRSGSPSAERGTVSAVSPDRNGSGCHPEFLFRAFIRAASRSVRMAKRYGVVSVTAVGIFGSDAI